MKLKNTIAKLLAVLSLAAFAHFPAVAQEGKHSTGVNIGGGPAFVKIHDLCWWVNQPGESCDDTAIGFKLFGNYRFTENFGMEASWLWAEGFDYSYPSFDSQGNPIAAGGDIAAVAFTFAGEAVYPFENGFSIFAKSGVNFWDYEDSEGQSDDGTDPLFGVGAEYRHSPIAPFKVRAEWVRLLQEGEVRDYDTDVFSLTAGYVF